MVHTELALRDSHPSYLEAKAGDADAALAVAQDLLSLPATAELQALIGERRPVLAPITALEVMGFNAIPDAMAQVLGAELGLPVSSGQIVQTNKVGHTRARAFNRLVTPAAFEGAVEVGREYVFVDDHVGLGGTLANLKGHIEAQGGSVIGMTTLTQSRDAAHIALRPATLAVLRDRYGEELEDFWEQQIGHRIECLTELEGQILRREPSVDAIRNRLAQAAIEAGGRGLESAIQVGG